MTATEVLRRMLDERGVEYRTYGATDRTWFEVGNIFWFVIERENGSLTADAVFLTPEQAIAVTLGRGMLTADDVRDLIERHSDASGDNGRDFHNGAYVAIADELNATLGSCNCSNSERTDAPRLPHFWTHDGTLHVELPKLPGSISVRLPDQRDRDVRSARVWLYTRDRGTCHDLGGTGANGEQVFNCSECGCVLSLYDRDGSNNLCTSFIYDYPRFCPECGRKVATNG